jgi:acetylornithine deacetylase
VDTAISDGAEASFEFLERLVASPSTVGRELPAQRIVAAELDRLGFEVSELSVPPETAEQASAGVAQADYACRPDVLGRLNPGSTPSLLLNGHVDVVPAESGRWASDPFKPVRAGGWLTGRGAGDMKGGFAMGLLAVAALGRAAPGALAGELGFLSVIEEECTGNARWRPAGRASWPTRSCCSSRPTWACCSAASASCGPRSRSPGSRPTPSPPPIAR